MDAYFQAADPAHIKREKMKARELRASQWWKNEIGKGVCYYCHGRFEKEVLTMDHVIPIVRGGKTTKSNVVVCCKECNSKKKHQTPVEMTFNTLASSKSANEIEP